MSDTLKPSQRAAMVALDGLKDRKGFSHWWGEIDEFIQHEIVEALAEGIEENIACDTLSADLARATDTLHKIKQILGNKGDTCKCGVCQALGLLEGVV